MRAFSSRASQNLSEALERLALPGVGPPTEPATAALLLASRTRPRVPHFIRDHGRAVHVPRRTCNRASNQTVSGSAIGWPELAARTAVKVSVNRNRGASIAKEERSPRRARPLRSEYAGWDPAKRTCITPRRCCATGRQSLSRDAGTGGNGMVHLDPGSHMGEALFGLIMTLAIHDWGPISSHPGGGRRRCPSDADRHPRLPPTQNRS